MRAFGFLGDGHGHADAGVVAVGGESFRAVQHPIIAITDGDGSRAAGVRAGFGLGERPAAEGAALRQGHDVFLLLRFGAEFEDVIGAERIVRGDDQTDRAIDAREFFDGDDVFGVAEARAAVGFRKNHAEQTHLSELGNDFGGEARGFVPLHDVRRDFGGGEFAHTAAQFLLFGGEREIQSRSCSRVHAAVSTACNSETARAMAARSTSQCVSMRIEVGPVAPQSTWRFASSAQIAAAARPVPETSKNTMLV